MVHRANPDAIAQTWDECGAEILLPLLVSVLHNYNRVHPSSGVVPHPTNRIWLDPTILCMMAKLFCKILIRMRMRNDWGIGRTSHEWFETVRPLDSIPLLR